MGYAMNLYHDQVIAGAESGTPLTSAKRMIFVRHGRVRVNDVTLRAGDSLFVTDEMVTTSEDEWSQIWRWEIAPVNVAPLLMQNMGSLSHLRMASPLTTLNLYAGDRWLFRLDQIASQAGHVAPLHTHAGPGIRCVTTGTFNFQEGAHGMRDLLPGDPFFETGTEPCLAWGADQMGGTFVRGMLLTPEWETRMAASLVDPHEFTSSSTWTLIREAVIEL